MSDLGKALADWLIAKGVDNDICHANVRAQWLEPKRKKEGDMLLSFFPSGPPADLAAGVPALPHSIPITFSGHDSESGVRLASAPPPAIAANAVTQVAP